MARITSSNNLVISYPANEEEHSDFLFKVILIGDVGVGKTSALQRFRYGTYSERMVNTIGVDFSYKTFKLDGKVIQLHVWDTAGQERYRTITQSYYRNAHGVIVAYDITRERTFFNVQRWLEDIKKFCGNVVILVIGTKYDLVKANPHLREVTEESVETLMGTHTSGKIIGYYEVSAKDGTNIDDAFHSLAQALKERVEKVDIKNCEVSHSQACYGNTTPLDRQTKSDRCC